MDEDDDDGDDDDDDGEDDDDDGDDDGDDDADYDDDAGDDDVDADHSGDRSGDTHTHVNLTRSHTFTQPAYLNVVVGYSEAEVRASAVGVVRLLHHETPVQGEAQVLQHRAHLCVCVCVCACM